MASPPDRAKSVRPLHQALGPISKWLRIPVSALYADLRLNPRHKNANFRKLISLAEVTVLCRTKAAIQTLAPMIVDGGHLSPCFRTVGQAQTHVLRMAESLESTYVAECRTEFLRILVAVAAKRIFGIGKARKWLRTPNERLAGRKPSDIRLLGTDAIAVVEALRAEYQKCRSQNRNDR